MRMPDLRRSARVILWTLPVVLLVLIGIAMSLAFFTGVCRITKVNFTGFKCVSPEYLRQLSGIDGYKNLVTLPVGRIATNLKSNAWIRDAHVQRHLLHTVNIKVDERVPVAVLEYSGTGFLVAADGLVIAGTPMDQSPELPRVHGGTSPPPTVASVVPDKQVRECVSVIGGMPPSMRAVLALGNPFDGRGQVFISRLGFNVIYGHDTDSKKKNEMLEAIVADVKNNKRNIAYIDLRVPDSPVIKPR